MAERHGQICLLYPIQTLSSNISFIFSTKKIYLIILDLINFNNIFLYFCISIKAPRITYEFHLSSTLLSTLFKINARAYQALDHIIPTTTSSESRHLLLLQLILTFGFTLMSLFCNGFMTTSPIISSTLF